ncbi:hypothetical protein EJB05_27015, partial [Eragrostis curvula]
MPDASAFARDAPPLLRLLANRSDDPMPFLAAAEHPSPQPSRPFSRHCNPTWQDADVSSHILRVHGLPGASGDEDDAGGVAKEARRRQREVSLDSKSASDKDSVAAAATATAAAGEDDHGGHKGAVVPALRVGARPRFSSLKAGPPTTSSLQPTTFLNAAAFRPGLASGNLASRWLSDGGNGTWKDRVVNRPPSLLACPLHTPPSGQFLFSHSVPESGSRSRHQLRSTKTTDGSTGEECFTIRFSAALEDDNMEVPDSGRMELVHDDKIDARDVPDAGRVERVHGLPGASGDEDDAGGVAKEARRRQREVSLDSKSASDKDSVAAAATATAAAGEDDHGGHKGAVVPALRVGARPRFSSLKAGPPTTSSLQPTTFLNAAAFRPGLASGNLASRWLSDGGNGTWKDRVVNRPPSLLACPLHTPPSGQFLFSHSVPESGSRSRHQLRSTKTTDGSTGEECFTIRFSAALEDDNMEVPDSGRMELVHDDKIDARDVPDAGRVERVHGLPGASGDEDDAGGVAKEARRRQREVSLDSKSASDKDSVAAAATATAAAGEDDHGGHKGAVVPALRVGARPRFSSLKAGPPTTSSLQPTTFLNAAAFRPGLASGNLASRWLSDGGNGTWKDRVVNRPPSLLACPLHTPPSGQFLFSHSVPESGSRSRHQLRSTKTTDGSTGEECFTIRFSAALEDDDMEVPDSGRMELVHDDKIDARDVPDAGRVERVHGLPGASGDEDDAGGVAKEARRRQREVSLDSKSASDKDSVAAAATATAAAGEDDHGGHKGAVVPALRVGARPRFSSLKAGPPTTSSLQPTTFLNAAAFRPGLASGNLASRWLSDGGNGTWKDRVVNRPPSLLACPLHTPPSGQFLFSHSVPESGSRSRHQLRSTKTTDGSTGEECFTIRFSAALEDDNMEVPDSGRMELVHDDKIDARDVPDAGRVERVHGLPGASGDEDDAGGVAKEARRRQREVSLDSKSASDKDSVAAAATATAAAGEDDHGGHKGAVVPALRVGARPRFSSLKAGPPTTSSLQPTTFLNAAAFRPGLASGNLASRWLSDGGNGTWKDRVVNRPPSLLACPLHTPPSGQFLFSHSVPESGSRSRHQLRSTKTTDGSTGEECFTIRFSAALEDDNMEVPDSGRMELVHDDKIDARDVPDAGRVERVHGLPGASGDEDDAGGVAKEARRRQREVSLDSKSASDKDSVAAAATATAAAGEDDHGGHKGAVVPALRVGARPRFSSLKAGPPTTSSLQPTTFLNAAAFRPGLASGNLASRWLSDGGNGTWKDRVVNRPPSLLACPLHTPPSGQFLFSHSVPESGSRSRHQLRSTKTTDGSTGEECFTIRFSAALEDDNMEVPDSGRMELVHGEIESYCSFGSSFLLSKHGLNCVVLNNLTADENLATPTLVVLKTSIGAQLSFLKNILDDKIDARDVPDAGRVERVHGLPGASGDEDDAGGVAKEARRRQREVSLDSKSASDKDSVAAAATATAAAGEDDHGGHKGAVVPALRVGARPRFSSLKAGPPTTSSLQPTTFLNAAAFRPGLASGNLASRWLSDGGNGTWKDRVVNRPPSLLACPLHTPPSGQFLFSHSVPESGSRSRHQLRSTKTTDGSTGEECFTIRFSAALEDDNMEVPDSGRMELVHGEIERSVSTAIWTG